MKKISEPDGLTGELYKHLKKNQCKFFTNFQKHVRGGDSFQHILRGQYYDPDAKLTETSQEE